VIGVIIGNRHNHIGIGIGDAGHPSNGIIPVCGRME
jgi:hypothetical protein